MTKQETQQHWSDLNEALLIEGAGLVLTGIHEDGYLYVHLDAPEEFMDECIETLKAAGYKGSMGRSKKFTPTKGDINGLKKSTHLNVEGYSKYDGEL